LKLVQDKQSKAYSVTGAPTKALASQNVTFTVTTAGKSKVDVVLPITVDDLPAWVLGTFDGAVVDGAGRLDAGSEGLVSLTVKADGGISGKYVMNSAAGAKSFSFKAKSFDDYYEDDGVFVVRPVVTIQKVPVTNTLYLSAGAAPLCGEKQQGFVGSAEADAFQAYAVRNAWSDKADTFGGAEIPAFAKNLTKTFVGDELGEEYAAGDSVSVKFGAKGKLTVSAQIGGVKLSGQAQLLLLERDATASKWKAAVCIGIPAKKNSGFSGLYRLVTFELDGGETKSFDGVSFAVEGLDPQ